MAQRPVPEHEQVLRFEALARHNGNVSEAARELGMSRATLQSFVGSYGNAATPISAWTFPRELRHDLTDGVIIVASDAHFWPGEDTLAFKGLLAVTEMLAPDVRALVANGDWLDGARTNRHDPVGWNRRPSAMEEVETIKDALHRWRMAANPKKYKARCVYPVGNHDVNFERRLAVQAKDFEGMPGLRVADHFSEWEFCWSLFVNRTGLHPVMIKHRQANGVHAAYNNAMKSGVTMVTGHTHALEVKPYGDYRGRRYGVQTGALADLEGAQFEYAENGYSVACAGFAVLTFADGDLLTPEIAEVKGNRCWFRGRVVAEAAPVAVAA